MVFLCPQRIRLLQLHHRILFFVGPQAMLLARDMTENHKLRILHFQIRVFIQILYHHIIQKMKMCVNQTYSELHYLVPSIRVDSRSDWGVFQKSMTEASSF